MRIGTLGESARRAAIGSIAVVLLTVVCFRGHIELTVAIPLYMLLVVLQSLTGDFLSSALIAALSAGCLDYFFTEPLFSLYIRTPLNGVALGVFMITALIVTRLVSWARTEAKSSRLQKDRLDRLYRLSQQLLALEPDAVMSERFLAPFRELFGVTAICAFDAHSAELQVVGESRFELAEKTRSAYIQGQDLVDSDSHLSVECLRFGSGGRMTGAIGFEGLRHPEQTRGSLAALTAALVERAKAFRNASATAAAAQAESYRSAILDALAHEFKTPLATILAAAGGIREAGPLVPQQREMADTVENEAARLGSLTSRLLRTARLDTQEIRPRMEVIDITSLIHQIVMQYSNRSQDRRIVRAYPLKTIEVLADPELLRLPVSQLLDNACKYSQPGSIVTIEIERQDGNVAVKISNSRSSIPTSERQLIFERFYRGAETKRSISGSGLGLYVARKIAVAHGGTLELETEDSKNGVTFCLKIPVAKDVSDHVLTSR